MQVAERPPSLPRQIADVGQLLTLLHAELRGARLEIARLQDELAAEQSRPLKVPVDLLALRRYVVFRCHPDRGGDTASMQDLNELFDFLQEAAAGEDRR